MKNKTFLLLLAAIVTGKLVYVAVEELGGHRERTVENRNGKQEQPALAKPPDLPVEIVKKSEIGSGWSEKLKEVRERNFRDSAELTGVMNDLFNELAAERRLSPEKIAQIRNDLRALEERKSAALPKAEVASFSVSLIDPTDPNRGLIVEPRMR